MLVGGAVALSLGVYGRLHEPTLYAVNLPGFSGPISVKVWLTSLAFVLALVQFVSALAMYGKLPGVAHAPNWVGTLHRWSGRIAFLPRFRWRCTASTRWGSSPTRRGCSSIRCWAASSSARSP